MLKWLFRKKSKKPNHGVVDMSKYSPHPAFNPSGLDMSGIKVSGGNGGNGVTLDQGHLDLESDVVMLLKDVKDFQFHDFRNTKYSLPKRALVERLEAMILKTKEGKYDN